MRKSTSKTTTVLTAAILGFGLLGSAAPSYADNNGSMASPAFPVDGVVKQGVGAPDQMHSAYDPATPRCSGS